MSNRTYMSEDYVELRDELARTQFERDVDLNAFMRFCVDRLKMPEPNGFSWQDGFDWIEGVTEGLRIDLQLDQITACHASHESCEEDHERQEAEIEKLRTACCMNNTHTTHWSDGYKQTCKTHGTSHTTDTGWNRW